MNPHNPDPLTTERLRMENLGKGFIILLFAMLLVVGHYFFNY